MYLGGCVTVPYFSEGMTKFWFVQLSYTYIMSYSLTIGQSTLKVNQDARNDILPN